MKSLLLCFFILIAATTYGQQYLQLETKNDPETIKFSSGDRISFKTDGAEGWQHKKIEKFILSDSLIIFENGYQHIGKLTKIRLPRKILGKMSNGLMQFGAVWTVYMIITNEISLRNGIIGGGSMFVGWIVKKLFYQRKYILGERYRLRLIDLSLK